MKRAMQVLVVTMCAVPLVACGLASGAGGADAPQTGTPSLSQSSRADVERGWQLVWSDEFEGDTLDRSKWDFDLNCWGGGNAERQCYTDRPENAHVEDGQLIITARLEDTTGPALPIHMRDASNDADTRTQPFSSARLVTRGKAAWRYGRVEVRATLPRGQGVWPAIWMLPEDDVYGGWASSGEIDIMEAINLGTACETCESGVEDQVAGTLHYGTHWPDNAYSGTHLTLPDEARGTHTYAIEWSDRAITWFVDDEPFACQTPEHWYTDSPQAEGRPAAPFDQAFHLIMNLAIGGGWPERENEGGVSYEGFPKELRVDFVRIHEWTGDGPMPMATSDCEPEYRGDSSTTGG